MTAKQFVSKWCIPPGIRDLVKKRRTAHDNTTTPGLEKYKGSHQGATCYILATGPSINNVDLTKLSGVKISVSFFYLHKDISSINPDFHIIAPNHPPFTFELVSKYINGISTAIPNTPVLYGNRDYQYSIQNYPNKTANIYEIDLNNSPQINDENVHIDDFWDPYIKWFQPRTVIYMAIQWAHFIGCSKIILVGCDHDYMKDLGRTEGTHFYEEKIGNPSDKAHLQAFTKERWFEEYYYRWKQYRLMREYLNPQGVEILDASTTGFLDVFPKTSLTDSFK